MKIYTYNAFQSVEAICLRIRWEPSCRSAPADPRRLSSEICWYLILKPWHLGNKTNDNTIFMAYHYFNNTENGKYIFAKKISPLDPLWAIMSAALVGWSSRKHALAANSLQVNIYIFRLHKFRMKTFFFFIFRYQRLVKHERLVQQIMYIKKSHIRKIKRYLDQNYHTLNFVILMVMTNPALWYQNWEKIYHGLQSYLLFSTCLMLLSSLSIIASRVSSMVQPGWHCNVPFSISRM